MLSPAAVVVLLTVLLSVENGLQACATRLLLALALLCLGWACVAVNVGLLAKTDLLAACGRWEGWRATVVRHVSLSQCGAQAASTMQALNTNPLTRPPSACCPCSQALSSLTVLLFVVDRLLASGAGLLLALALFRLGRALVAACVGLLADAHFLAACEAERSKVFNCEQRC